MTNQNKLKLLKNEQLKLLDKVVSFFDDNKIVYFIAYGTLLGAVRHKNYIPWDDDIDLWLKREDYNKLINLKQNYGFSIFHYSKTKNYPLPFIKIVDNSKYSIIENSSYKIKNLGINIDIFPLDYIDNNKISSKIMFFNYKILRTIMNIKLVNYSSKRNIFLSVTICILKFLLFLVSIELVVRLIDFNSQLSQKNTKYFTSLVWGYGSREVFPTNLFNSFKLYQFGKRVLKGPLDEIYILSKLYGEDYLKVPPVKNRISHHHFELRKK
jgi:lipopolysaccharide cholinephosphotransferase